jgi:hypothetical protein
VGTVIDIFEEVVEKREHHPAFVHLLRGEEGSYYWPVEAREGYVLEPRHPLSSHDFFCFGCDEGRRGGRG